MHVLLKRAQRESGQSLANFKQKRFHTEKERGIFEEAWDLTKGLRESMLARPGEVDRPTVLEMLQRIE